MLQRSKTGCQSGLPVPKNGKSWQLWAKLATRFVLNSYAIGVPLQQLCSGNAIDGCQCGGFGCQDWGTGNPVLSRGKCLFCMAKEGNGLPEVAKLLVFSKFKCALISVHTPHMRLGLWVKCCVYMGVCQKLATWQPLATRRQITL